MSHKPSATRVLMLGMVCAASLPVLDALLAATPDIDVIGLAVPGAEPLVSVPSQHFGRPSLPMAPSEPRDPVARAYGRGIPVHWLGETTRVGKARLTDLIHDLDPDAVVAGCFPWLVPPSALAMLRLGALNVHPSLLPALRGPEPLFWAFRRGEQETGVSVHLMDASFDTGPILVQERISLHPGARLPAVEQELMTRGGRLAVMVIRDLTSGRANPVAQDVAMVSLAPPPTAVDWLVSTDQTARSAFTFAHAVAPLGGPLTIALADGHRLPFIDAVEWHPGGTVDQPMISLDARHWRVQFQAGTVDVCISKRLR